MCRSLIFISLRGCTRYYRNSRRTVPLFRQMARAIARAAILTDSFHVLRQSLKVTEMKIAAAQIDCVVGDIAANTQKMREFAARAKQTGAELVVFPETADTGYSMRVIRESATTLESGAVPALRKL